MITEGNASSADIAFYFLHWFCDLAGAEPYPLQGCEKFVLKFPLKVLGSFIDSFGVVWTLSPTKTETRVLEDYFVWRWTHHDPPLGAIPTGQGAVAKLRLVLMAQGDSVELLKQFDNLDDESRVLLSEEMAVTGAEGQSFEREPLRGTRFEKCGPALLVYYGPALMQKAGRKDPKAAMKILAEVFRRARELWPLTTVPNEVNRSVTIRIDAIKDLEAPGILKPDEGHEWLLEKTSGQDGRVVKVNVNDFSTLDWKVHEVLTFTAEGVRKPKVYNLGEKQTRLQKLKANLNFWRRAPSK